MTDLPTAIDEIYSHPLARVEDFVFDQKVVDVFPDMIKRSVPGYATIVHMIGQLAGRYCQSDSRCYDLGCSLGAATLAMGQRIHSADSKIIAIDNSPQMVERCRQVMAAAACETAVEVVLGDIQEASIERASVCVLNFTLQFVPIDQRKALLQRVFDGMLGGGILIISEKLCFEDAAHNELMRAMHHDFKKNNGYSEMEIAQKRDAIEKVLLPESFNTHKQRLQDIGFKGVELWFQCFNFASFIAFKS